MSEHYKYKSCCRLFRPSEIVHKNTRNPCRQQVMEKLVSQTNKTTI